jgi:serine/threonine-protein kinase
MAISRGPDNEQPSARHDPETRDAGTICEPPASTIERLFELALACEPRERAALLERACGDPDTRREVNSLLEADGRAHGFLELPTLPAHGPDEHIGPYRLLRKISEGEASSVYLAVRDDGQYRQHIVIKLIRPGIDSHHILQRFLQERQILASLVHPNIARLLDGGSTSTGQPYLVMEYVDGEPLDIYCRSRNLPIALRLELFITVCQAVHFAHRSLVVHRDLKPSNILVGADGTPKLLDFGIAKLLDPELVGIHIERTATAARVMTPNYASPEQVLGTSIGTGSDIYSLGVILYELLTGCRPYELGSHSLRDIERIVCESSPPPPSLLVRRSRRERPARDLDNIVLMAMRKEPERRYASAHELAADVRRCLDHRPVLAQRDTLTYRLSSFVRRHVGAVVAAATIAVLLLGGAIATTWAWRQAVAERTRAETQRRTAEQTLTFLIDLFKIPDSHVAVRQVNALELLDHGVARLRGEARESLTTRAALQHTLGVIYLNLGDYAKAAALLEEAIVSRSILADSQLELADSLCQLGAVEATNGRPDRALALLRRALTIRTQLLGEDDPLVAEVLEELSNNAIYKLPVKEAEAYLRRAVDIRRRHPGSDELQLSSSIAHLAELYSFSGRHDDADALVREAITVRGHGERCRAGDGEFFNYIALSRYREGYFEEAERYTDNALECLQRVLGPDHPNIIDLSAIRIALWREQGRYAQAEELARSSLLMRRQVHGDGSPADDNAQHHLAYVLYERGKLAEAERFQMSALDLQERRYGHSHDTVASGLVLLGDIRLASGDAVKAEGTYREAITIWQQTMNADPEVATAWRGLATALLAQDRVDAARSAAERSLALQRLHLRPMHPAIASTLAVLGEIALATSPVAAEPVLHQALTMRRIALAPDHPYSARTESVLGECMVLQRRVLEALPLLRHSAEVLRAQLGDDHPDTLRAANRLHAALPGGQDDSYIRLPDATGARSLGSTGPR